MTRTLITQQPVCILLLHTTYMQFASFQVLRGPFVSQSKSLPVFSLTATHGRVSLTSTQTKTFGTRHCSSDMLKEVAKSPKEHLLAAHMD